MSIIAVIPAKKDSNRLSEKNSLKINNKSLYEHAINYAKTSELIDEIVVSTDCKTIKQDVESKGYRCVLRGPELSGEALLFDVYKQAFEKLSKSVDISHIVGLQPDNPDRGVDLEHTIKYSLDNKLDDLFTP